MSYSSARSKDWDDILTAHSDETFARTWTMLGKRLGKYNLGFMEDPKGKGKERKAAGAAKVNSPCMKFLISSNIPARVFA